MAACLLLLMACQKDDEKQAVRQTGTGTFKVSTITFDQFKTNTKAFHELEKIMNEALNKSIIDNGDGFFYNNTNVTVIAYGDYKTYTFEIHRNGKSTTELLENLIIREKNSGSTDSYVVQYNLNRQERLDLASNKPIAQLINSQKIITRPRGGGGGGGYLYHREDGTCYTTSVYDSEGNKAPEGTYYEITVPCPDKEQYPDYSYTPDDSSGGSGSSPVNVVIFHPGPGSNGPAPQPGGPGSGGYPPPPPVITKPTQNILYLNFRHFIQDGIFTLDIDAALQQKIIQFIGTSHIGFDSRKNLGKKILDFIAEHNDYENGKLILDYLIKNKNEPESIQIAEEMIEAIENGNMNADDINEINKIVDLQDNSSEGADAFKMLIKTATKGYINKPFDQQYYNNIDQYTEANLSTPDHVMWAVYFNVQCAILKRENPTWSRIRVYWEASKEMVHIALDVIGLVPVVGEVADLTNGVIYTLEGDGLNATLSFASMIPVVGIGATTIKYAKKTINITTSTKTTLKWLKNSQNIYTFGNRSQLRKVLNLATGDPRQAHHIIPWGKSNHPAIQKAAGSGNAFHMNQALNGIPLNNAVHSGSHTQYDNKIIAKLNLIPANATPQQTYDAVIGIINNVKTAINNNPGVHINQLNF